MHGRKGHGIWLPARPRPTTDVPRGRPTAGVVLTNYEFARLTKYLDVSRTPVVMGRRWNGRSRPVGTDREAFLAAFGQWKADWESRDTERYFTHYSASFRTESRDLGSWKAAKRRANAGKSWIKVGVDELSLFAYPGAKDMMMVTFEQDYRSSNLSNRTVKRQYWVREGRGWRILHEAVVS